LKCCILENYNHLALQDKITWQYSEDFEASATWQRPDNRQPDQLRAIRFERDSSGLRLGLFLLGTLKFFVP